MFQVKKSKIGNLLDQYKKYQTDIRSLQRDVVRVYICKEKFYVSSGDTHIKKTPHTIHITINFSRFLINHGGFYQELDEKYT